jgi:release factor glutamine methyltransferase
MLVKKALEIGAKKLQKHKINSALLDAEILLSFVLNKPKEFLFTHPENKITKHQSTKFQKLIDKRCKYYPIAYLIGYKEFYGLKFLVDKNVLIPRPLTEELIEKALTVIEKNNFKNIIDIGTGSGCIIIALANELRKKHGSLKNFRFYATDVSTNALKVAKKNVKLHKLQSNIKFYKDDLLEPLKNKKIDLILANLPYLTENDIKINPYLKDEPKRALLEKTSGKTIYKKLFSQAEKYFKPMPIIIYEDKKGIHLK